MVDGEHSQFATKGVDVKYATTESNIPAAKPYKAIQDRT
jgi:hypothetical protein